MTDLHAALPCSLGKIWIVCVVNFAFAWQFALPVSLLQIHLFGDERNAQNTPGNMGKYVKVLPFVEMGALREEKHRTSIQFSCRGKQSWIKSFCVVSTQINYPIFKCSNQIARVLNHHFSVWLWLVSTKRNLVAGSQCHLMTGSNDRRLRLLFL